MTRAWFETDPRALQDLERLLRSRYPTLHAFIEDGVCVIRGTYAVMDGGQTIDRYDLEIALPPDYPASLPDVWETGSRIPREMDRHVFPKSGCLCLGIPLALWIQLKGDFSLQTILDIPVRNYLIGNSLVERDEPWPHGDRSHGVAGVLEFYGDLLGTSEPMTIANFLLSIVKGKVRGHWPCLCGSGNIIRNCHKDAVEQLRLVPTWVLAQSGCIILDEIKRRHQVAQSTSRAGLQTRN
ncbi:MAG: hypothetical protein C0465_24580 [Ralstonia sp.]|nr:hypothetical protein [Ralstonia sp.]